MSEAGKEQSAKDNGEQGKTAGNGVEDLSIAKSSYKFPAFSQSTVWNSSLEVLNNDEPFQQQTASQKASSCTPAEASLDDAAPPCPEEQWASTPLKAESF